MFYSYGRAGWSSGMLLLALSAFSSGSNAATTSAQKACDRQCLTALLKNYESAMLKHDSRSVPFAASMRMIENYKPIKPGEGYWQNVGKIHYQTTFADPVSEQVAAVGFLDHGGRNAYYALRLKVEGRKVTQSEMLLIHKGDAQFFEEDAARGIDALYAQAIPTSQRSTREQLLKLADAFTDTWQYRNEDLAPYAATCRFFENNVELTNNPAAPADPSCGGMMEFGGKNGVPRTGKYTNPNKNADQSQQTPAGTPPPAAGNAAPQGGGPGRVATQRAADPAIGLPALFGSQMWMRDRRYPIVDVDKGVVFFYHVQGGTPAKAGEPVVYERATAFGNNPNSQPGSGGAAYMAALMKVVDGKIVRVDHFEWEGGPNASAGFAD